jgi:hypothetical protein
MRKKRRGLEFQERWQFWLAIAGAATAILSSIEKILTALVALALGSR